LYTRQVITKGNFGTTKIFQKSIDKLATGPGVQSPKMPQFLREKLEILAHSLKNEQMFSTWAHGDFTPWNCFVAEQKIHLYDFELSCSQMPFGFDAFHFVLQQGILAERLTWSAIKPQMRAAFDLLQKETGLDGADYDTCLKAYLLVNIAYYWQVYSQQEKWHPQIMWLLNTWNDALSDLLAPLETPRKLLIGDVFDFLQHLPYAAVKFPNIHPKALSEYTDIDLLMQKSTAIALFAYLQNHSAVQKIGVQQQSNMMTLRVLLHDGSLLALDLIWQLRRKALVFMSLAEALEQAVLNEFGIKTLSAAHTQSYLKYFYGLNNSAIPVHYAACFENGKPAAENRIELKKQIAQIPDNKGIKSLYNHVNYLLDTLKKPFRQRGIVITFSGVDGAGKSTIIEHTKKELEKKWRKRVVVIRHRPSLLPILSAFTQGKKKAEQKAASTLPRQGSNKNLISSLLRFAYYYSDYLLGQFYVYARYVMHGHIVLYDRYYFDFINDPLRSNIRLPRWLTKAGYQLLLRAPLNFFLYADPDTILGRKKELDAQAITQLTNDYLSLFKALDKHSPGRYFSVENLQLADTVHFITTQTRSHLI
jgi:thymidylate kinase